MAARGKEGNMTQEKMILDYMSTHPQGITPREAMEVIGCMRLASRISDLRKAGHPIRAERVEVKNKFGHKCIVCRYSLVKEGGTNV